MSSIFNKYYLECKKQYKGNKNNKYGDYYKFTFDDNVELDISLSMINKLYQDSENIINKGKLLQETSWNIALTNQIYNMNEIEYIANKVIPYLECNLYHCYLSLMRCYIYKNKYTSNEPGVSWLWHWDCVPKEYTKIMIYLTDTDSNNGSFEVLLNNSNQGKLMEERNYSSRYKTTKMER